MANELIIAKSIKEAASLIKEKGNVILAGGTEVNRLNSPVSASTLVSIGRIAELDGISLCTIDDKPYVKLLSMTTFQEALESTLVPSYFKEACLFNSSLQKRCMATIGGNIAAFRDDSYLMATLLSCHAGIEIYKGGKFVTICSREYVQNQKLRQYMITAVYIPKEKTVVSKRYSNTAASHAFLTVSASMEDGEIVYGICAKNSGIFFASSKEDVCVKFKDDMFGSRKYKDYILKVTLNLLAEKARGGKS